MRSFRSPRGDLYVCAILKFLRDLYLLCDLYLATPSDAGMTTMLGHLEPMCHKEQVLERTSTVEMHTEREEIYKNHRETQAALVDATAAAAAAAAAAVAVAGVRC